MVAAIEQRRTPSTPPRGPTTVPPTKPEQGSRAKDERLHVRRHLHGMWRTLEMVCKTAFEEQRCPATGTKVEDCAGCRGPRVAEAPADGALPHFPAVLAYIEGQARMMRKLLDLHQHLGREEDSSG